MFSAFNPSKCTHTVRCLVQGSHLSRGQFLPEPKFEPTTSGYKSKAQSTRPRQPVDQREDLKETYYTVRARIESHLKSLSINEHHSDKKHSAVNVFVCELNLESSIQ